MGGFIGIEITLVMLFWTTSAADVMQAIVFVIILFHNDNDNFDV
jgi:hypothetical protein